MYRGAPWHATIIGAQEWLEAPELRFTKITGTTLVLTADVQDTKAVFSAAASQVADLGSARVQLWYDDELLTVGKVRVHGE